LRKKCFYSADEHTILWRGQQGVGRNFESQDMTVYSGLIEALAPTGVLRAAINLGNPILAYRHPQTGEPAGVSVDMASALAQSLGLELTLRVFDSAGQSVEAASSNQVDIGFFAIDPLRGKDIAFSPPYVLIEGSYMVREGSAITHNEQVDEAGIQVTVGKGSAYDLYLTRCLKRASIVRAPTSPTVVDVFLAQGLEVAAGVRQQLESDAHRHGNLRVLPGRFMVIEQAMGTPKVRGPHALASLSRFVEDMKASGKVAQALAQHGIQGASVAPVQPIF
jgi:polar amino acid transport system substrate-binding protein